MRSRNGTFTTGFPISQKIRANKLFDDSSLYQLMKNDLPKVLILEGLKNMSLCHIFNYIADSFCGVLLGIGSTVRIDYQSIKINLTSEDV